MKNSSFVDQLIADGWKKIFSFLGYIVVVKETKDDYLIAVTLRNSVCFLMDPVSLKNHQQEIGTEEVIKESEGSNPAR